MEKNFIPKSLEILCSVLESDAHWLLARVEVCGTLPTLRLAEESLNTSHATYKLSDQP
jgi:hypothetical protein